MGIYDDIKIEQELATYAGEDRMVLGAEALGIIKAEEKPKFHVLSHIPTLDQTIGGFYGGQLVVLSGTTGHGKTTMAQTLTTTFADQGVKSSWFSYEVSDEDFLGQFKTETLMHFYIPLKMTARTIKWIEARALESSIKYGANVVFIDHLHYLLDFHKTNSISFDVGSIVRGLKEIAKVRDMIIVLICHTTKTAPDKELDLGDARDSSFIEQESDVVLYLWRDRTVENASVIKVAKNRKKGSIGRIIGLEYVEGRYYERAGFSEDDYRAKIGDGQGHLPGVGGRKKKRIPGADDSRWNY